MVYATLNFMHWTAFNLIELYMSYTTQLKAQTVLILKKIERNKTCQIENRTLWPNIASFSKLKENLSTSSKL